MQMIQRIILAAKLGILSVLIVACASAPVQQMSDARQAIVAAEQVGAEQKAVDTYLLAKDLMRQAEDALNRGYYGDAERFALEAKKQALSARQKALLSE